jgi:small subunit ribosomal protein S20
VANSKSAMKRDRQNQKIRARNKVWRSRIATFCRKLSENLDAGDVDAAKAAFTEVSGQLDRAANKGIVPKSRASRKKARLAKRLHAIQ